MFFCVEVDVSNCEIEIVDSVRKNICRKCLLRFLSKINNLWVEEFVFFYGRRG